MSTNMKAFAVLLAAMLLAPEVMAQTNPPAGGGTQPQTTTPAPTETTPPAKTKVKKGKKKMEKGEKKMKKGEKGKMQEKKGMEEKGATTPSNTPPNP